MLARGRLEVYWLNTLSPSDRTAWRARWTTRPPTDALGRTYQTAPRSTLQQTVRPEETVYAWTQIFGVYRFDSAAVAEPAALALAEIEITNAFTPPGVVQLTLTSNGTAPQPFRLVVHATEPLTPSVSNVPARLRPVGAFFNVFDGDTLDVTAQYFRRFAPHATRPFFLRASHVNANNELDASTQLFWCSFATP